MKKQDGNALLNAIVVAGIIAGVSAIVMMQTKVTDQAARGPRIRAAMAMMQNRVQALASQYTSYTCTALPNSAVTYQTCAPRADIFGDSTHAPLRVPVTGASCPSGTPQCGVNLTNMSFDNSSMTFRASIVYEGTEVPVKKIDMVFKIPGDIMAAQMGSFCSDPNYPIFNGYDPDTGLKICSPFPSTCTSGISLNTQGAYIAGLDSLSLNPVCNMLGPLIGCAAGQYLTSYSWNYAGTGSTFTKICGATQDPFTVYPYTHTPGVLMGPLVTIVYTTPTTSTTTSTLPPTPTTVQLCGGTTYSAMCFVAGTPVSMADDSTKNIEDVQIGDLVKTFDESTGQMTVSPVVETLHHPVRVNTLYTLTLSNGKSITSNDIHPYYLPDENIYATAPQIADRMQNRIPVRLLDQNSHLVKVVSVKKSVAEVPLYNLHVISPYDTPTSQSSIGHNYFAGGVLVHNLKVCADATTNIDYMFTINCYQNGDGTYTVQAQCQYSPYTEGMKNDPSCSSMTFPTPPCDQTLTTNIGTTSCAAYCGSATCANLGTCSHVIPPPWNGVSGTPVTTTTMPIVRDPWNCWDGFVGGACGTGLDIVDDGGISGTNPGVATMSIPWNGGNGDYDQRCVCPAGTTKTLVSCQGNEGYFNCAGEAAGYPSCTYGQAIGGGASVNATAGYNCFFDWTYSPHGAWNCAYLSHHPAMKNGVFPCP